MVDESKEWQCLFCTYLNSLEVDVCEMCAKSRQSVASGRTGSSQNGSEEFVSGNSQMDNDPNNTTYDESELEYPDTHPNAEQNKSKASASAVSSRTDSVQPSAALPTAPMPEKESPEMAKLDELIQTLSEL